ncbi:ferredoxin [Nocardia sp. NPDC057030]|uniref:ferredoxin n=1 Tax=unclassified Nocardia TaxID=2637762 RepID=UPI0036268F06
MRVSADRTVCIGAGLCALTAPTVFDQDDNDGLVKILTPTPGPSTTPQVREAADICPSGAVTFTE